MPSRGQKHLNPQTGRTRRILQRVLLFVLLVVFCLSAYFLWSELHRKDASEKAYDALSRSVRTEHSRPVVLPPVMVDGETPAPEAETPAPPAFTMDFDALLAENEDTVGWLTVPAADIDYPIVQGETNDTYLNDSFWHVTDWIGVPFVDSRIKADFLQPNTIIYGHAITKGAMFTKLTQLKDPAVVEQHPFIYLYTPDGLVRIYRIYGTHTAEAVSMSFWTDYQSTADFEDYLAHCKSVQDYDTGITASPSDRILTLVTCEDDRAYRFVVQARLVYEMEASEAPLPQ